MTSPHTPDRKARRRFTVVTFVVSILLLAWGAFVTSIDAGLAVPDWPTSFNSFDPFNPWPEWWTITPVLAEHGHRLLGALVGLLTLILAIWTWLRDDRPWMRRLAVGALVLVILQGTLGGLRVVWVSLDLAVVHAAVAQLFFALMACMILFVSPSFDRRDPASPLPFARERLPFLAYLAPVSVYIQIILGALLRHPGTGIDPLLAGLHIVWALITMLILIAFWTSIRFSCETRTPIRRMAAAMGILLIVQVGLGIIAYLVLLDESGQIRPSNVQVLTNTAHMVVGALLFASTVGVTVLAARVRHLTGVSPGIPIP